MAFDFDFLARRREEREQRALDYEARAVAADVRASRAAVRGDERGALRHDADAGNARDCARMTRDTGKTWGLVFRW